MKEIPKKNYYILAILLLVTMFLTLFLSNLYFNKEKNVSSFYECSNKITPKEFDQFMTENANVIIYISEKYDLEYEKFEEKLKTKLDDLNLRENLVFIDKNDINKKFITKIKNKYGINIDIEDTPILLVIIDNEIKKNVIIDINTDVDSIIEHEVFE